MASYGYVMIPEFRVHERARVAAVDELRWLLDHSIPPASFGAGRLRLGWFCPDDWAPADEGQKLTFPRPVASFFATPNCIALRSWGRYMFDDARIDEVRRSTRHEFAHWLLFHRGRTQGLKMAPHDWAKPCPPFVRRLEAARPDPDTMYYIGDETRMMTRAEELWRQAAAACGVKADPLPWQPQPARPPGPGGR